MRMKRHSQASGDGGGITAMISGSATAQSKDPMSCQRTNSHMPVHFFLRFQFAAITRIKARSVLPNRVWHRKESCSMQSSRTTGATQPFWPPSPGDLSLTPTILSAPSRHASFPFDRRPPPRPSRRATSLPPHAGSLPPRPEAAAALTPAPPPPPPPPPSSPLSLPLYVLPKPLHAVERHLLPPI